MRHADLGGGGDVYFQYDAAGTRVRKVVVNANGTQTEERLYLGAVELYRERTGTTLNAERQTLHIADDTARIAIVETLTVDAGSTLSSPPNIARYQHANHLSTVSIELDDAANIISYEEFHPYGTSAYRAVDSTIAVSAKRYRYAGKERDHETGLDHMGARLYAPWLARWTSTDPIGLGGGINRYEYAAGNPVGLSDPSGTTPGRGIQDQWSTREPSPGAEPWVQSEAYTGPLSGASSIIDAAATDALRANKDAKERAASGRQAARAAERRARDAHVEAKVEAGEPLFAAQGTGTVVGRAPNSDAHGNRSNYLQVVNESEELYGPQAVTPRGGPATHLVDPIVEQGGPAGDQVFGALLGAALQKGGFLAGKPGARPPTPRAKPRKGTPPPQRATDVLPSESVPAAEKFRSVPNKVGDDVLVTDQVVDQPDFLNFVETAHPDDPIQILTGLHGDETGLVSPAQRFAKADRTAFRQLPNVEVVDLSAVDDLDAAVAQSINAPGATVCAFCFSDRASAVLKALGIK